MKLRVFRSGRGGENPRYDVFSIGIEPGMSVLSALFTVFEEQDDSLAFRYSCRGAVCGTCAMLINKVPRLACRTQVSSLLSGGERMVLSPYPALEVNTSWDPHEEILVEPLPHLPVIKDLVVEMDLFFKDYQRTKPVLMPAGPPPNGERLMSRKDMQELERYTNCILCAVCYGGCPVNAKNPEYLGPAALAKLYRFHIDPREARDGSRLLLANYDHGWWACEFHGNCTRVCPKYVPPSVAIGLARQELEKSGKGYKGPEGKEG
jgi:succinate dehydrogenase iron-sulfur subunit